MTGRHRGDPADEVGTLPILDGVLDAVRAEMFNAQERHAPVVVVDAYTDAVRQLAAARVNLRNARQLREEAQ